jgi:hypothetical protein
VNQKHLPGVLNHRSRNQNLPKTGKVRESRADTWVETLREEPASASKEI